MPWEEFHKICNDIWQQNHSYIIIKRSCLPDTGKYIANFREAYIGTKKIYNRKRNCYEGINSLDAACKKHDLAYTKYLKKQGVQYCRCYFS